MNDLIKQKREFIEKLKMVDDFTSQLRVREIREKILMMNIYDKNNEEIFKIAKEKGICL